LATILSPLTGLLVMGRFSPRLTPWATLFPHSVADGLRAHCQNLTCASVHLPDAALELLGRQHPLHAEVPGELPQATLVGRAQDAAGEFVKHY